MGENTDQITGDQFYLAQRIWDASMGKSLADLRSMGAQPAVLLVGAFHILENGATVLEYSYHRPSDEILTVSLVPDFFEAEGLECQFCDLNQQLPLDSNSMDVILSQEGIEHISDQNLAFKEFSRVLKKGGTLILSSPNARESLLFDF